MLENKTFLFWKPTSFKSHENAWERRSFLDFEVLRPLIDDYHLDRIGSLASQLADCKLLLNQTDKPRDIPDLISKLNPAGGFPDLRRLLKLALTVPIANVAAERSFSSLHKIRTYVHSTMVENRLTWYCSSEH